MCRHARAMARLVDEKEPSPRPLPAYRARESDEDEDTGVSTCPCQRRSHVERVELFGVFGPEFALVGGGAGCGDLFQGLDPLGEGGAGQADGPVAAEDDSVGAEGVEAVVDGWGEGFGGPL